MPISLLPFFSWREAKTRSKRDQRLRRRQKGDSAETAGKAEREIEPSVTKLWLFNWNRFKKLCVFSLRDAIRCKAPWMIVESTRARGSIRDSVDFRESHKIAFQLSFFFVDDSITCFNNAENTLNESASQSFHLFT